MPFAVSSELNTARQACCLSDCAAILVTSSSAFTSSSCCFHFFVVVFLWIGVELPMCGVLVVVFAARTNTHL